MILKPVMCGTQSRRTVLARYLLRTEFGSLAYFCLNLNGFDQIQNGLIAGAFIWRCFRFRHSYVYQYQTQNIKNQELKYNLVVDILNQHNFHNRIVNFHYRKLPLILP